MQYNFQNIDQLEDLYLHDSKFDGFRYYYLPDMQHAMEFTCDLRWPEKIKYSIRFLNVAYHEMQAFTLWSGGDAILWLDAACTSNAEIQSILDVDRTQINAEGWNTTKVESAVPLVTINIRLNSGDRMRVICESVVITEEKTM